MYIYKIRRRRPASLKEHLQRARYNWLRPFFALEWIWDWLAYLLGNWSFLEVLESLGTFSILLGVILYFAESGDREKQKHYQAWQVINTAQGKGGSGGRKEALQELVADHVDLVGVDVSDAFLSGVRLPSANLARANLRAADIRMGVFDEADLEYADLSSANIRDGSLVKANLENAMFADSDLNGSNLTEANCEDSDFSRADLRNCELKNLKWKGIKEVKLANLFGVKDAPEGFIKWAMQNGAVAIESDGEWDTAIQKAGGK
ncbi:MAG: pentapeptide repeat-containing protein [Verrucomicrobia bacterium]|nr:pentapeptide repeat-containing protein [Verrucomicrobiota bacterium]